jgi:hypothetical protein
MGPLPRAEFKDIYMYDFVYDILSRVKHNLICD